MEIFEFGNLESDIVLIQVVGDHDAGMAEKVAAEISRLSGIDFKMAAFKVKDWNQELSPWEAPPVFGNEGFGAGAAKTLKEIEKYCNDSSKTYIIGGYSLAGLFALWAGFTSETFAGVAAASPSMWFPGFDTYMKERKIAAQAVYLSLGDKEEKTKNPVMNTVGDKMRDAHKLLSDRGVNCIYEVNPGNHFAEPDVRVAKAFAWVLAKLKKAD